MDNFFKFYLFSWQAEREKDIFHLHIHSPNASPAPSGGGRIGLGLKLEAKVSMHTFHMHGRNPITQAITTAYQICISSKLESGGKEDNWTQVPQYRMQAS